jgi:uncharacterized membrane protein
MDLISVILTTIYIIAIMISVLMVHRKVDLTSAILFVIFTIAFIISNLIVNNWFNWSFLKTAIVSFLGALLFMIILLLTINLIFVIIEKIK